MSTKHAKAAEKFLENPVMAAWHNETLWMVRAKRDKMSKEVPEWEELRDKACALKLYSNSHLEELLLEFEKNATANGAIVHWAKDAEEYRAIVYEILSSHGVKHFVKSKSMLAEECELNPFLIEKGIDVVESDLGERILQLMNLAPSHIVPDTEYCCFRHGKDCAGHGGSGSVYPSVGTFGNGTADHYLYLSIPESP